MMDKVDGVIFGALDAFKVELPSWGFANTGTRFGKFLQPAAAISIEDKFSDAAQVHALTGACPTLALHVQWDLPKGLSDVPLVEQLAEKHGVQPGSINPNVFQDQEYKYGSLGNPDPAIRKRALDHILECVAIANTMECRDISPWFADGSNYPGTQSIRKRIVWFEEALKEVHRRLNPKQRLLIEYKPFEPAFYHTDVADWGMALLFARAAGPQALVLVDTGHHYQTQNIEQIVAWLLHHEMMGGFHFNDRRYADDDLTLGSIDPYQIFRIFHEIRTHEWQSGGPADIAYMVDQSHNLKGKIEAMIQSCSLVEAEECLRGAFWTDVRPALREWRQSHGLPEDPLLAFKESGYLERITAERRERNAAIVTTYA
jgi:L-rhamnose isomerase/sugar isomerase